MGSVPQISVAPVVVSSAGFTVFESISISNVSEDKKHEPLMASTEYIPSLSTISEFRVLSSITISFLNHL